MVVFILGFLSASGCGDVVADALKVPDTEDTDDTGGTDTGGEDTSTDSDSTTETDPLCASTVYEEESDMVFEGFDTGVWSSDAWQIYRDGTIVGTHTFDGETHIHVAAWGESAGGEWPHMIVHIGDQAIGDTTVGTPDAVIYTFPIPSPAGTEEFRIELDNDNSVEGEDINLFVQSITINCTDSL